MQMLSLLKHPCAVDYLTNITTLLTDLGATQSEVNNTLCPVYLRSVKIMLIKNHQRQQQKTSL